MPGERLAGRHRAVFSPSDLLNIDMKESEGELDGEKREENNTAEKIFDIYIPTFRL